MHHRPSAMPICGLLVLAAVAAALGAGCRGPTRAELRAVRAGVAACPVPLEDAALDDLASYERCTLAPAVARLVRNDYADDEPSPPDLRALGPLAGQATRPAFEAQRRRFVDPAGVLDGWVAVDAARGLLRPDPVGAPGLELAFAPGGDAAPGCTGEDCAGRLVPPPQPDRPYRPARRAELRAAATPERPLAGLRVAVDPGHAGGAWGALEERRVAWRAAGSGPSLQEGDLTLRTALELRDKLRARGAEVTLTREGPEPVHGLPLHAFRPFGERLLSRIALDPEYARVEAALAPPDRLRLHAALVLFAVKKQHRYASLRARAERARAAGADLLLSVHYNAASPRGRPPEVLTMIRGAFAAERLYNPAHRARALAAALDVAGFDAAAHLGAACAAAMANRLGLPVAGEPRYPDHVAVRDARGRPLGVDAWDGALLRYAEGPAVLTEGPCYDDPEEQPRLAAALASPLGARGTRTERYADALAACVEEWARRWATSEVNPFGPFP